ncbi:MAG: RNA-binding S4 domain-containing protein [Gemmatimonadales bacterium]|nr:RNA-binding S4 domain-containing protein [Gemmatimonadales bacterium]
MKGAKGNEGDGEERYRLDSWLWAARFFKTRALAAEAIDGGKVHVNGDRAKRAKALRVGDEVRIRVQQVEWVVQVRDLSDRRGPASVAQQLYEETEASRLQRERQAERMRSAPPAALFEGKGRPSKKDRRDLDRWRERD